MNNPYKQLKQARVSDWEVVENSALTCQYDGCYAVTNTGEYSESAHLLRWTCQNDHVNEVAMVL